MFYAKRPIGQPDHADPTTTRFCTLRIYELLKKRGPIEKCASRSSKTPSEMCRFSLSVLFLAVSVSATYNGTTFSKRHFVLPFPTEQISDTRIVKTRPFFSHPRSQIDAIDVGFVKINRLLCENSAKNVYFRASLTCATKTDQPVIETVENEQLCPIQRSDNECLINFSREQFASCGIVDCSDERDTFYCLTVRFPRVSGLKMRDDFVLTLQCKPRERVVSHVKQIHLKSYDASARTATPVAIGGYKNSFNTDVALFRRTYNSDVFDTKIEAGGGVLLGEQLLLRVAVKEGDGWTSSKIGEVKFQKPSKRSENVKSMVMLDANGCVDPQVHEICPADQYKTSAMENYLQFEAFMFDGMRENDEMLLSVRAVGCLDSLDCALDCSLRKARAATLQNLTTWQADVSYRMIIKGENDCPCSKQTAIVYGLFLALVLLLLMISCVFSRCLVCSHRHV